MDAFANEKDFELLEGDRYTFAVLARVLRGKCEWVRTDHENLILCRSEPPYPVWIWTADGCAEPVKETAWAEADARCPLARGYSYNLKHELAEYFLRRGREAGLDVAVSKRLFAYDCPALIPPEREADGALYVCTEADLEETDGLLLRFYAEIGETPPPREHRMENLRAHLADGSLFFWKNAAGETVARCSFRRTPGLSCIGGVYTLPEHRRKRYAQSMVGRVTGLIRQAGDVPMLYTNAEYPASNACYAKLGYVLRGRVCTLSARP
jgi:GNAT superfamily N-acetyltransferase